MIGGFPPKLPPQDDWITLSSALTWLGCNHALELHELLDWADQVCLPEDELRQLLTNQWQQLIDHRWTREIQLKAKVTGDISSNPLTPHYWRPFRHVGWNQRSAHALRLLREPIGPDAAAPDAADCGLRALDDPLILRTDVVTFKKVRSRVRGSKAVPDYEGAERDLRSMLSALEPQTGLKWGYVEELVEQYDLPEYQAVRMWTEVTRELGFPDRGRPKSRNKNARQ